MAYVNIAKNNGSLVDSIRAAFRSFGREVARRRVYRTTLHELNNLSARDLAGLGIHRSEIRRLAWEAAQSSTAS